MDDKPDDFIQRLDDLLQKYNDLISVNYDKEFLRIMELQEAKYKEKINNLEAKLRLAKTRLKYENSLRKKAEVEKEQLAETLQSLSKSNKIELSSSTSGFETPKTHLSNSENELNGNEYSWHRLRKHCPNASTISISKIDTNNAKTASMLRWSSKRDCPVTSRKKSPEFSYLGLGVSRLDRCNRLNSTSFNKTHEPFSIFVNGVGSTRAQLIDETDGIKLDKTSAPLTSSKPSPLKFHSTPNRIFGDSDDSAGNISDFTPLIPPMIPSIVIHCIDEIEKRGLKEINIYRMPGNEEEMIILKEIFDRDTEVVNLSNINIHSIAHFLKTFLRNYPLIPKNSHYTFAQIISEYDRDELYVAISSLAQPNRDTLAYLLVHLRRVAGSVVCRMPVSKLSVIFAPIIFGLHICDKENELKKDQLILVIEEFLKLPSSYWQSFIVEPSRSETPSKLRNSPSTEQIVRNKAKKYFTPPARKKRFFTSPTFEEDLEEVIAKISIIRYFFDDLTTLLNSIERTNDIKTQIKTFLNEVTTTAVAMDELMIRYYDSTSHSSNGISSQDKNSCVLTIHPPSSLPLKVVQQSNKSLNKDLKKTSQFQTILDNYFSTAKNFSKNDVKQEPKIRDQMAIKSEAKLAAGRLTPIQERKNLPQDKNNVPTHYPIFQENINTIVYSPVIYKILTQKAGIKTEQALYQQVGTQMIASSSSSKNDDEIQLECDLLPPERPAWWWNENVPTAIEQFTFLDPNRNYKKVYCCRVCFEPFLSGISQFNHERELDINTKKPHFEYYCSSHYLRRRSKSKYRR